MTLLLDTHVWLWSVAQPDRLRPALRDVIEAGEHEFALSPISGWEALLLHERSRIDLGVEPAQTIEWALTEYPITVLPITMPIALRSRAIDIATRDPADRLIAATAIEHRAMLLTHDSVLLDSALVPTFPIS